MPKSLIKILVKIYAVKTLTKINTLPNIKLTLFFGTLRQSHLRRQRVDPQRSQWRPRIGCAQAVAVLVLGCPPLDH